MTIAVFGMGFVGLTTALGLCERGQRVFGVETDSRRRDDLAAGRIPFHEPGLAEALARHGGSLFSLAEDWPAILKQSDVLMFCVGTPCGDNGRADLDILKSAIRSALAQLPRDRFRVLVVKSTVPPGTLASELQPLLAECGWQPGIDIGLANNPEFLREGVAWEDFLHPDRVVIGAQDERSAEMLRKLYAPFLSPVHVVSWGTAEFIKYLSNTLLATLISFSNEMAMAATAMGGIDVQRAFRILHEDRRWHGQPAGMAAYAYPGCGFGGYCLPKDTAAMAAQARAQGMEPALLDAVLATNRRVREFVVEQVCRTFDPKQTLGVLGLAFKPDSDDVRDSPSADIIRRLLERGYRSVLAYDPIAAPAFQAAYGLPIRYAKTLPELVASSEALLLLTAWREFRDHAPLLRSKLLLDFRYCLP